MSAICPACGVAVVPGYVRCPKCRAALPYGAGRARAANDAGGTAVQQRGFPIVAVVAPVVIALAIALFFGLRGGADKPSASNAGAEQPAPSTQVTTAPVATAPVVPAPSSEVPRNPAGAARDLERSLRGLRLWSTIEIVGTRIDVRSASCGDRAMVPPINAAMSSLREGGLTKLRCLAQSGAVVFEREL